MAMQARRERPLVRVWRLEVRQGRVSLPEAVTVGQGPSGRSRGLVRFSLSTDADGRPCLVLRLFRLKRRWAHWTTGRGRLRRSGGNRVRPHGAC